MLRDTSVQAANSIADQVASMRAAVLMHITAYGTAGRTCDECEQDLGMRHQTASARINDLKRLNAIEDSGDRRKTISGRSAIVWVVAKPAVRDFSNAVQLSLVAAL